MKFTEVPYFLLKMFFLEGTGISKISYDDLINMTKEEYNQAIEDLKEE